MRFGDKHHLKAAQGWLGLGDWQSANEELEEISPAMRAHPDVLKLRVAIYCKAGKWQMAATLTDSLVEHLPKDAGLWLQRATACCQLGRFQEAHAAAASAFDLKPDLRQAALDNPELAPLWANLPA